MRIYLILFGILLTIQQSLFADLVITQQNVGTYTSNPQVIIDIINAKNVAVCFDSPNTRQSVSSAVQAINPAIAQQILSLNISSNPTSCAVAQAAPPPAQSVPPTAPTPQVMQTPAPAPVSFIPPAAPPAFTQAAPPPSLTAPPSPFPPAPAQVSLVISQQNVGSYTSNPQSIINAINARNTICFDNPATRQNVSNAVQPLNPGMAQQILAMNITSSPNACVAAPMGFTPPPPQPMPAGPRPMPRAPTPAPGAMPAPPMHPAGPVVGIRPPLAKNDLDKLVVEDKNKSDALMIKGLRKIANASYVTQEVDNKKFLNPYEAYIYVIKKVLVDEVGNNDSFKLRQQLLDLVGQKDQLGGSLQKFAADHLQIKGSESEFLKAVYANIEALMGQFQNLLKNCFFYEKTFDDQAALYVSMIFANIICAQRTGHANNDITKKSSNDLALALMKGFAQSAQKEFDELSPTKSSEKSAAPAQITFTKDYIMWLADQINRLRVNADFYRYNNVRLVLDACACAKNCGPVDAKKAQEKGATTSLTAAQLYKDLSEELFFDSSLMVAALPSGSPLLDAVVKDHERRVELY